eukprot:COSAG01_NODE_16_length_40091_cov_15.728646_37_plen_336_part_00
MLTTPCQRQGRAVLRAVAHQVSAVVLVGNMSAFPRNAAAAAAKSASCASAAGLPPYSYVRGQDFSVVTREQGSERLDLPVWQSRTGLLSVSATTAAAATNPSAETSEASIVEATGAEAPLLLPEPERHSLAERVPGAFLLHNALSPEECQQLIAISEAMGYTEDAPVSLGRHIRQNENVVWIADDSLWRPLYNRVAPLLDAEVSGRHLAGLNQRWRLYKYGTGDIFKPHTDGQWTGSAVRDGKLIHDVYGDRTSVFTLLYYLNDDFGGGETSFYLPLRPGARTAADFRQESVPARAGTALVFPHGNDPRSPLHEGSQVHSGTKYVLRTDVLYTHA